MPRHSPPLPEALQTLYSTGRSKALPLPAGLARLYGDLHMPFKRTRPYVISNFVTTLKQVRAASSGKLILVEGGPRLLGHFYAEQLLDEQFLTLAPQIAGRDADDKRLSLVMGRRFAPASPLWGDLVDLRRGGSHLYLRYAFPRWRG